MTPAQTNEAMKAGRFLRWQKARKRVAFIETHLAAGRMIQLTTYTHCRRYTKKHLGMFRATKTGAYVQRGKHWDCIDGVDCRAFDV